jgi:hypothetical protein
MLLSARWPDPDQDELAIEWVRTSFSRLDPQGTSSAYSNYTMNDDPRAVQTFEAGSALRLAEIKRHYDPRNVFRRNHNLNPTLLRPLKAETDVRADGCAEEVTGEEVVSKARN